MLMVQVFRLGSLIDGLECCKRVFNDNVDTFKFVAFIFKFNKAGTQTVGETFNSHCFAAGPRPGRLAQPLRELVQVRVLALELGSTMEPPNNHHSRPLERLQRGQTQQRELQPVLRTRQQELVPLQQLELVPMLRERTQQQELQLVRELPPHRRTRCCASRWLSS